MTIQILETDYAGTRRSLFWLALKTSVLTVLTVGFYRFWAKTRVRRFYWSAIRPGGFPLEYTGTGVEKLMGFLVAVVFLAFYIGVLNLILMFISFSLLNDNFAAYFTSFIGIIPIYFYAQYRARRYVLARTRWRGLRFGIDAGAWGYSWRAMLHWLATILTLGFLLPRQMFCLEKFRIDRTWYGRERFTQEGNWRMLLKPATHYYVGLVLTLLAGIGGYFNELMFTLFIVSIPWLLIGWVHLQINGFKVMAQHKRLGEFVTFRANPSTWRMIQIYLVGSLLIYLLLIAVASVAIVVLIMLDQNIFSDGNFEATFGVGNDGNQPLMFAGIAFLYFTMFIFIGVLGQLFITLPSMRHYAETLFIRDSHHLGQIRQRPRDEFAEAEGFADALDIGAAI
ncbi:MAG: DUF898 family protein [Rhodobacterales bacterium]